VSVRRRNTPSAVPRRDLAALLAPLMRSLLAAEREVAERHGLTMWGYAALHGLADQPVRTQTVLATSLGIDKTRLIPILDDLQERDLIRREPDPDDRRVHVLSLTPKGRRLFVAAQKDVHAREDQLLVGLDPKQQAALRAALETWGAAR